jgi:hypothetical protein
LSSATSHLGCEGQLGVDTWQVWIDLTVFVYVVETDPMHTLKDCVLRDLGSSEGEVGAFLLARFMQGDLLAKRSCQVYGAVGSTDDLLLAKQVR